MINLLITPTVNLGLLIISLMVFLLWIGNIKPEISADIDLIIVTLGVLYGFIIIVHGWRLDPILFFSQVLLIFTLIIFGFLIMRLRMMVVLLSIDKIELIEENKKLLQDRIIQNLNLQKMEQLSIKNKKLLKKLAKKK